MYLETQNIFNDQFVIINTLPDGVHNEGNGNHGIASHLGKNNPDFKNQMS